MTGLARFLKPQSVATFGGGWAVNVIEQLQKSGYSGDIWPVHPSREQICGIACYPDIESLPGSPDASFVGVNRELTIEVIRGLNRAGAGGAICFASGFKEADNSDLQDQLLQAAGDMPILGPNCYGLVNYLDNVCLWPDQHGGKVVDSGVAIIAQSSNISISMSMQQRGLPLACLFTAGNQAQIGVSRIAQEMIADPRVSAIGLYLEGFDDIRGFEQMAMQARSAGKPIVALKIGKTEKARAATISHTATLAGNSAASSAFLKRLGIVEVDSISVFLETLKLLDGIGPLAGPHISSVSCSGGEASLMADLAQGSNIEFRDFTAGQLSRLGEVLGPKVDLANPLDYHTYIWGDVPTMTACFAAVIESDFDLNVFVLDLPREDVCATEGHQCAIDAIIAARQQSACSQQSARGQQSACGQRRAANVAVLAMMPENLSEAVCRQFLDAGVVPLLDMETGLAAIDAAIRAGRLAEHDEAAPALLAVGPSSTSTNRVVSEYDAKSALSAHGLAVPGRGYAPTKDSIAAVAHELTLPLVLKGLGIAHKTEAGAVILNIDTIQALGVAIETIPDCDDGYLVEEMVGDIIAELIVGVTRDEQGLYLLTIGAGGVLAELMEDTVSVLLPAGRDEVRAAIDELKIAKILNGYRGRPAANLEAVLDAIEATGRYVEANHEALEELDINPLAVTAESAVALDALIRLGK